MVGIILAIVAILPAFSTNAICADFRQEKGEDDSLVCFWEFVDYSAVFGCYPVDAGLSDNCLFIHS